MTANILMLKIVKTNIKAVEFSTAFLCIMNRKDKSEVLNRRNKNVIFRIPKMLNL